MAYAEARLVVEGLDTTLTFAGYLKNLQRNYDLRRRIQLIEDSSKAWIEDEECVESLRMVSALLRFEVNRIYKFWYGDEPRLDFEGCRSTLAKLPEGLRKRAEAYLKKLQSRGIKSPADP